MVDEEDLASEAESEANALEVALLTIIGAKLLATRLLTPKAMNAMAVEVQREAVKEGAKRNERLAEAAKRDVLGLAALSALDDASAAYDVAVTRELSVLEEATDKINLCRVANDVLWLADGAVDSARREYMKAARWAARNVNRNAEAAVAQAIMRLAQKGITAYTVKRKDGTSYDVAVDVGIRRAVQSSDNKRDRMANTLDVAGDTSGLVEVSTTSGARKSHADWQGKVYQLEGDSPYPNFYKACHWGDPVKGIGGYNCRHQVRVYRESRGRQFADPLEGTGYAQEEARDLRSRQRALENGIRKDKREAEVLRRLGLDRSDVNRRIKAKRAALAKLVSEHPRVLEREPHREFAYDLARKRAGIQGAAHLDKAARARVDAKVSAAG